MNNGYKLQNGHSNFLNQTIPGNPPQAFLNRANGKIKLSQNYLLNESLSNDLLKSISIDADFLNALELVELDRCDNVFKSEDTIRYVYFPESAVVSEFQILENGKTVEISMTGHEGLIGINAVFSSFQAQNFSQVLIPGRAFRINTHFFQKQITACSFFRKSIFDYVSQYISQISQRVVCNNQHSTEERLCLWLLMISKRCGKAFLPLTQEQIARFLGVHRPSVTLVTQNLRNEEIIDYSRGKVSIINQQKLKTRACACYLLIG